MSFPQAPKVTGLEMLPFPPERQDDSNRNEKGRELGVGGVGSERKSLCDPF